MHLHLAEEDPSPKQAEALDSEPPDLFAAGRPQLRLVFNTDIEAALEAEEMAERAELSGRWQQFSEGQSFEAEIIPFPNKLRRNRAYKFIKRLYYLKYL